MSAVATPRFVPGDITAPGIIDLAIGYPDLSVFPAELIDLQALAAADSRTRAFSYGPPKGSPTLTEALFATLLRDEPRLGSTLLTNGSIEAIDLVLRALSTRGDVLLSEDPCFPALVGTAELAGLRVVGVRADHHGIDPDALEATIDGVRLAGHQIAGLYTMPSASNPTGARLCLPRRHMVAALASSKDVLVIEDDAYRAVNLGGLVHPTLHSLNPDKVLHLRSLSKVLCPGFRLAIAIGPDDVVEAMMRLKPVGGTTPLGSELLAHILSRLDFDQHLRLLQDVYSRRRDMAIGAVRTHLPDATFTEPSGGFFLWVRLPDGTDPDTLYARAASLGVSYLPEGMFTVEPTDGRHIRLSFSYEPPDRILEGIRLLGLAAETARIGGHAVGA
jgi:2-aminoadipate transaminase